VKAWRVADGRSPSVQIADSREEVAGLIRQLEAFRCGLPVEHHGHTADQLGRGIKELRQSFRCLCCAQCSAERVEGAQRDTVELLAAYAHEAWCGWMKYLFLQVRPNADGSLTLPAGTVDQWHRQSETPYAELSDGEQESDRAEARKMLAIVEGE